MSSNTAQESSVRVKKQGISPTVFVVSLIVVLIGGILAGTYRHQLFATVAPVFGIKASSETIDTELLQQSYRELLANYDGDLDRKALMYGAARGMVEAAGDEYTVFFDPKEAEQFDSDMSGSIGGGIGAQIGVRSDRVTLVKIIEGTPAERSGLLAGDAVLEINGQSTKGYTTEQAVEKIRGEIGTTVKLQIDRGGEVKDFSITREEITSPSVTKEVKDNVGIITISRFDQDTASLVREAAEQFKQDKVRGVVLDMRGNPGGYLTAAKDVAGVWLDRKVVVVEKEGDKVVETLKSGANPLLNDVDTVVLIDSGSASASEIVAGALKDHGAATIMGETSFGKGSVQRIVTLQNGAMLKVTVARWYTPNGKNIAKSGITPDKKVSITEKQLRDGDDVQMKAALKHLE